MASGPENPIPQRPNSLPLPKGYQRLGGYPIDESDVFYSLADLQAYAASPASYSGHIVSHADHDNNKVHVYKILPDKSLELLASGEANATAEGTLLSADITVNGGAIGSYQEGDVITAGTSLAEIVLKIFQKEIAPNYTAPSYSVVATGVKEAEIGTAFTATFTPSYSQNDAGPIVSNGFTVGIKNDGGLVFQNLLTSNTPENFTTVEYEFSYDAKIFEVSLQHSQGDTKNNNLGNSDARGRITSGTLRKEFTYSGFYKAFFGSNSTNSDLTRSSSVRALKSNKLNPVKGETLTINIATGSKEVAVAVPSESFSTLQSIKYVELGNAEVFDNFIKEQCNVELPNGSTKPYNVFIYRPEVAFGSAATFKITL
ncbi:hypothetical protein [Saccharicrinis aurantiacus]|uniref:hypothetical protein n=1 Tax=Saccharicrinis aurantiacus TaxID=1849719 RepID=UPI00094F911B|nr:hypothetical protein [Saccharicrinis aurantiacus]